VAKNKNLNLEWLEVRFFIETKALVIITTITIIAIFITLSALI